MKSGRYSSKPTKPSPLRTIVGKDPNFSFDSSIDQMMRQPVTLQTAINPPQPSINKIEQPQVISSPKPQPKQGGQKREEIKQEVLPEKQEQQELLGEETKKNLRDAGIIVAGALSSFGAGISGGNQAAASQQMFANLDRAAQADLDKKLADPSSEESKRARELGQELYGNKIKIKPNMSAKEFMQTSPYFEKIYNQKLREQMARAKSAPLAKPILDTKQIDRLDQAKRFKGTASQLAKEIESSSGLGRLVGTSPDSTREALADDLAAYKAILQGQGQASDAQLKAARQTYAAPSLLQSSKSKAKELRAEGDKYFQDEVKKLIRQGFQAKEMNGTQYLVNPQTGEYIEL